LHVAQFNAILWRLTRMLMSSSPSSFPFVSLNKNAPPNPLPLVEALFLLLLPGRWPSAISICSVSKFVIVFYLSFIFISSSRTFQLYLICLTSFMCRVQNDSPIRVLNADMFSTPSTTFELPPYAAQFANVLAEAPSPPPVRTRPFNIQVLDFMDIEAVQGENSERHASPHVMMTHSPSHM
jgi:hypothetical protein